VAAMDPVVESHARARPASTLLLPHVLGPPPRCLGECRVEVGKEEERPPTLEPPPRGGHGSCGGAPMAHAPSDRRRVDGERVGGGESGRLGGVGGIKKRGWVRLLG
jgi:hypothetical protein